jgi:T5SS/PEP-CTERM-associated repeat protein
MMEPSVKPRRRQLSCSTSVAALLAGAVIIGGIVPAEAGTPNWIGAPSGDWFSGTNWDTNAAPGAADTVFVDTTTPNKTTLDGGVGTGTASITSINVGFSHTGDLTITNGGSLGGTDGAIGYLAGSQGTVTVTGINSRWNSTGFLSVGRIGDGTLVISNGASASDDNAFIGEMANSTGHVTVDGSGSS